MERTLNENLWTEFYTDRTSPDNTEASTEKEEPVQEGAPLGDKDEAEIEKSELKTELARDFPLSGGEPDITFFELGGDNDATKP